MPSYTPLGTDALVNTNTGDGQISPRVVALADGRYMVIWVGAVSLPVVPVGGTIAPSYANADIRGQIFNADGTRSGSEFVINTTTDGGQLRPVVTQLSDGNVLITWHDGVGPSGGSAETTPNTIRGQEFSSSGAAVGGEFAIGNSNGRVHSIAATATGGFVVTFEEGGVGGTLPVGNIVSRIFDAGNAQTGSFIVDSTQPVVTATFTAVESDGDIWIYRLDRDVNGISYWNAAQFNGAGALLTSGYLQSGTTVHGIVTLATGGHAIIASFSPGNGLPVSIFAMMHSADGSLTEQVSIADVASLVLAPTITETRDGGFIATWGIDSDPGTAINAEIVARAYNAIGNPVGEQFQINSIVTGNQSSVSLAQLSTGDVIAAWIDESQINGDASGTGISLRRIDYDSTNHAPVASDFTFTVQGGPTEQAIIVDPNDVSGFFGPNGFDADGDPLFLTSVSNVSNGTVVLNPDGTLTLTPTPGATGRIAFDYTVSDALGATSTARATVTLSTDYISIRPGDTALIDFLANDFYTPTAAATPFNVSLPGPISGGSVAGRSLVVGTSSGLRVYYNPLALNFGPIGETDLNSPLFNLLAGTTAQYQMFYYNNENLGFIYATVQGWAQLGGTGADTLIGTSLADHLSGGTGAANVLQGGLGNDWYTVAAAGDTIIEAADGGSDSVRAAISDFILPENVENLRYFGPISGTLHGTGNAGNNLITSQGNAAEFYGLGGNDVLVGSYANDILYGGDGDDRLVGNGSQDLLDGGAGDDRIEVNQNNFNSTVVGGTGSDTLVADGAIGGFAGFSGIEAIAFIPASYMAYGQLTLTGTQFANGLHFASTVTGNGQVIVNMDPGVRLFATRMSFSGGASLTVNGTAGTDVIKAALDGVLIARGGDGVDQIRGSYLADTIYGDGGNDKLMGLSGADQLSGGAGADQFRYLFTNDSGLGAAADRILDFTNGEDKLDFRALDADPVLAGRQTLSFIGTAAFVSNGTAQVRYADSGTDTLVQIDLDGNGSADMEIVLAGHAGQALAATDFLF